jgi:hypothetical protein
VGQVSVGRQTQVRYANRTPRFSYDTSGYPISRSRNEKSDDQYRKQSARPSGLILRTTSDHCKFMPGDSNAKRAEDTRSGGFKLREYCAAKLLRAPPGSRTTGMWGEGRLQLESVPRPSGGDQSP